MKMQVNDRYLNLFLIRCCEKKKHFKIINQALKMTIILWFHDNIIYFKYLILATMDLHMQMPNALLSIILKKKHGKGSFKCYLIRCISVIKLKTVKQTTPVQTSE